jgi:hypothetical protein
MTKVILKNVRASFPSVFETEKYKGTDTGKFTITALISKDDPQVKTLKLAIAEFAREKFGNPIPKKVESPLKDGDEKDLDGYQNCYYIKASNGRRPVVIDRNKTPLVETDGRPYAGCYVNLSLDLWAQDNQYGKGVRVNLNGVQFASDGDAFGSVVGNAMDDFEELETVANVDDGDPFA